MTCRFHFADGKVEDIAVPSPPPQHYYLAGAMVDPPSLWETPPESLPIRYRKLEFRRVAVQTIHGRWLVWYEETRSPNE